MTKAQNDEMDRPVLYGVDMHSPAWVTAGGHVYFPAMLTGSYRDLVLEWRDQVVSVDLKSVDLLSGLGQGSICSNEKWRGPIVGLSGAEHASVYLDGYKKEAVLCRRLPSLKPGLVYWGLDDARCLHSIYVAKPKGWAVERIMGAGSASSGPLLADRLPAYEPEGLALTVERIIERMGQQVSRCRRGRLAWKIRHGTAVLELALREKTGLLAAEVHLVRMDTHTRRVDLMAYLLRENRHLGVGGFSLRNEEVLIARSIPVKFVREEATALMLSRLLERCDAYDNHLVHAFGAVWG
jgi:hypothetical protein